MTIVGCKMAMKASLLGGLCAAVLCMGMAGAAWAETTAQSSSKPVTATEATTQVVAAADTPAATTTTTTTTTTEAAKPVVAKHTKHKKHKKAAKPAAAAATAAPVAEQAAVPAAKAAPASEYVQGGAKTCLQCHATTGTVAQILNTPHAKKADARTPFASHECESCHGASPQHLEKGETPTVVFKGPHMSPVEAQNKVCLTCHQNGLRMNWQGSQHQSNDLACASCHTIHVSKDPVLVKATQPEKCFTCHAEQRAESFAFSHHPIREGKVVCSDCHNPHGTSGPKLLKEDSVNDTCYTCHADKRGPFLWEHEPVREDCTNCHMPHGSNQARLLKDRPPFLCQDCHANSSHQSAALSGSNLPGTELAPASNAGNGFTSLNPRMLARGCVNCHSNIHGSNSPAGQYFER